MAYVYIIESQESGRFYIGCTIDIDRRIGEHKAGKHHSSKRIIDPKLVFQQEFDTIELARRVERKIKAYKRKDFIEKIIKDGRIKKSGP